MAEPSSHLTSSVFRCAYFHQKGEEWWRYLEKSGREGVKRYNRTACILTETRASEEEVYGVVRSSEEASEKLWWCGYHCL